MNIAIIFFLIFLIIGLIVLITVYGLFTKDKLYFKFCYIALSVFTIFFFSMSYKDIYKNYQKKQKYISGLENPAYNTYDNKYYGITIDYPNIFSFKDQNKNKTYISLIDKNNRNQNYYVSVTENIAHETVEKSCSKRLEITESHNSLDTYKNSSNNQSYIRLYTTITGDKLNDHDYILYHEDKTKNLADYICVRVGKRYIYEFAITYDLKNANYFKGIIKHTYDSFSTPNLDYSVK